MPNSTTVATATAVCSARARSTGLLAITAAAPQMALPAPISRALSRGSLGQRTPISQAAHSVVVTISTSITSAAGPRAAMSWKVRRRP
ncbi:hypothetical protein D9M72_637790 [compost metagenome]